MYYLFNDKRDTPKKSSKIRSLEKLTKVVYFDKLKKDRYYKKVEEIFKEKGKEIGKCMLFLYKEETPILEIQLKNMTVFLNSENEKETEEWYNYARDRVVD